MRNFDWRAAAILVLGAILAGGRTEAAEGDVMVGDQAPEFTLPGTDGQTYSLAQFRGQKAVVLAWFPKAMTSGCTAECKSFRDYGQALRDLDVAYFTASTDRPEDNQTFSDNLSLDFPILSDPGRAVAQAYGVVQGDKGNAKRWTFYIDKEGIVRAIDKSVKTPTAGQDVVAKLKELGLAGE